LALCCGISDRAGDLGSVGISVAAQLTALRNIGLSISLSGSVVHVGGRPVNLPGEIEPGFGSRQKLSAVSLVEFCLIQLLKSL
jgi:hypothetical protein